MDVPEDGRIAVVGGMNLHPRFAVPFARERESISCRDKYAQSFGIWFDEDEPREIWEQRAAQVVVHFPRYNDEELATLSDEEDDAAWNQLVIELLPVDALFSVVVAATGRRATLRDTVENALSRLQDDDGAPNARFTHEEGICLPAIDLHCEAKFGNLQGLPIVNAAVDEERLGEVWQRVHFRLDEGGSSNPSTMRNPFGGALMSPRRWYFNPSFNLVLVIGRRTRIPLLSCWFSNSEAFVAGSEPAIWRQVRRSRRS